MYTVSGRYVKSQRFVSWRRYKNSLRFGDGPKVHQLPPSGEEVLCQVNEIQVIRELSSVFL